jgi:short-subunit dehydrogenase
VQFQDKVVVVTGAAGGIGRPLCIRAGREGARIGLIDRNEAALERLREELKAAGVRCASAAADVRDRAATRAAVDRLTADLGPVDVLVAGAGLCAFAVVDDLAVPQLEEILQVNFLGAVYAIEAVLPEMLRRGSGQIVGIASLAAVRAIPFEGAYCASKAAIATYLESLRPPLRRRGVLVTTVFPGFVRTPLLLNLLASSGAREPPGTIDADDAARRIADAIRHGRRVACFPWSTSRMAHLSRFLPPAIYDWVMTRMAARVPLPY